MSVSWLLLKLYLFKCILLWYVFYNRAIFTRRLYIAEVYLVFSRIILTFEEVAKCDIPDGEKKIFKKVSSKYYLSEN